VGSLAMSIPSTDWINYIVPVEWRRHIVAPEARYWTITKP
jgi:hypothetical protein